MITSLKKKSVLLPFFSLIILISCENKEQSEYFDSLDLELTGIVQSIDLPSPYNGFGILKVSVIKSNFNQYDPRESKEHYYCIIRNGQAELYQFALYDCEIGDSIEVSTKDRLFLVHKKTGKTIQKEMILYDNDKFYDYIKKNHQKL